MAKPRHRHPEARDAWPRALLLFGAGLLVFLALAAIALKLLFNTAPHWPPGRAATNNGETNPALQESPATDLATFRKREDDDLGKLGWVDRGAGIARIPIDDAMKLIVAQGLPDWRRPAALAGQNCALLEEHVPRAPQLRTCDRAVGQPLPDEAARRPDPTAPAPGVSP